jgi:hypothetical protein
MNIIKQVITFIEWSYPTFSPYHINTVKLVIDRFAWHHHLPCDQRNLFKALHDVLVNFNPDIGFGPWRLLLVSEGGVSRSAWSNQLILKHSAGTKLDRMLDNLS